MYRIILVDDEPLILAGIASLIKWEEHGCTIIGKATNGPSAYDLIMDLNPDIVITDIRMPVLNGLELVEKCKQNGSFFSFIVLTNLEEFNLAKKALTLGAVDYLVKLNLSPEELLESLQKAIKHFTETTSMIKNNKITSLLENNIEELTKQYFTAYLYDNANCDCSLLESLHIDKNYTHSVIIKISLCHNHFDFKESPRNDMFHSNLLQIIDIINGLCKRFFKNVTILQKGKNTLTIICSIETEENYKQSLSLLCQKINTGLITYFELFSVFGISECLSYGNLSELNRQALSALEYYYYDSSEFIVFYQNWEVHKSSASSFNINFLKKDLQLLVQQNDSENLNKIFRQIIDLFQEAKPNKELASSACIKIYTYLYSYFDNEDTVFDDVFPHTINIVEQIHSLHSLKEITKWLDSFCNRLCRLLYDRKNTPSDRLIDMTLKFIHTHYEDKLTLSTIADTLNISPGYLSSIFRKCTKRTLSDTIAYIKVEKAKELIDTHKFLMYEISDKLGFDNAYYFSKVFKKITGISPRDYENR